MMSNVTKTYLHTIKYAEETVINVGEIWKLMTGAIVCIQEIVNVKRRVKKGLNKNLEHHEILLFNLETGSERYIDLMGFAKNLSSKVNLL